MKKLLLILAAALGGTSAEGWSQNSGSPPQHSENSDQNPGAPEEVVVTGSLIRGSAPIGSQLIAIGSADITATGATNTADLLNTVPQISSFNSQQQGGQTTSDTSGQTPPRLHSLPPGATLTLIDGHRLVGDSPLATYPDPSSIPPGAIDHIEVLADGGSAIYGSDAVAGVINIILKKNFEGAETSASYGVASQFNNASVQQIVGHTWQTGSVIATASYESNPDLPDSARRFYTANLLPYGGQDFRYSNCAPANVEIGQSQYAAPNLLPGTLNECDPNIGSDIINQNRRYSFLTVVQQDLGDRVHFSFEGKYSDDRQSQAIGSQIFPSATITNANPFFVAPAGTGATSETVLYNSSALGSQSNPYTDRSLMLDGGATIDLPRAWSLSADFDYGWSKSTALNSGFNTAMYDAALAGTTTATALDPFGSGTAPAVGSAILDYPTTFVAVQSLYQFNVTASGAVVSLPGGDLKIAVGAAERREEYGGTNDTGVVSLAGYSAATVSDARDVASGYAQVLVPIFGKGDETVLLRKLDLSAAVRYDHYSDFGGTTNPKFGLNWTPVEGLTLRSSYGRSFHAPQLSDLDAVDTRALLSTNTSLVPPGAPRTNAIILAGGNPGLLPETARSFSGGFDVTPTALPGFKAGITYFKFDYSNQINTPPLNQQVFLNPTLFSDFVVLNPTSAQLASAIDNVRQTFSPPLPPIGEILDFTRNNIGQTKVEGWDFDVHYNVQLNHGTLIFALNGEYLTEYETQQAPGSPFVDNLKSGQSYINLVAITPFHARGSVAWENGPVTLQAALNYTGGYKFGYVTGGGVPAIQDVAAFPTVDLFGSWLFGTSTNLAVNVFNVLGQRPPLLLESGGFSSQTANPIGREFMLSVKYHW